MVILPINHFFIFIGSVQINLQYLLITETPDTYNDWSLS